MNRKCNANCLVALSALLVLSPINVKANGNEWISTNGEWKYKSGDSFKVGWFEDQKCWYYADYQTALLKKGWVASGDAWYYLNPVNAIMQESRWVDGETYYIGNNGAMVTDTIVDGKEILADGSAIAWSESKSVVLTDPSEFVGKVIEGNLYITQQAANDLVLSDVTVKGKIVVEGGNEITLKNVKAAEVKNNKAETTINFEGTTAIDKVTVARSTSLIADGKYKGSINEIVVQSTTKTETIVGVRANEVVTTTYAPTTINEEVGKVSVKQESTVKLNANVKELVMNASAGHSKIEVAKDVIVDKATVASASTFVGEGTITKLEAKVDNIVVDTLVNEMIISESVKNPPITSDNVVVKPEDGKPSGGAGGGGAGGGGNTGGGETDKVTVTTFDGLQSALKNSTNITVSKNADITVTAPITLAEGKTLTIQNGAQLILTKELTVYGELNNYGKIFSKEEIDNPKGINANNLFQKDLRLNIVKTGKVKALNDSIFKFDSIDQIATNDASFMVYNNSSIYIGDNLKVGKTGAMVDLKPIEGSSLDKPLAAYEVNGDGTVVLRVLADATINDGLDCMVGGWMDSIIRFKSTIKMEDYNSKNSGMIDSNYEGMLFIDDEYMVGREKYNGELPVFSGRDIDRGSITFSTLNGELITGVLGNATINQEMPEYMSLYPRTNIISRHSVVTNKSDSTVKLYTINRSTNGSSLSNNPKDLGSNVTLFWTDDKTSPEWKPATMEITGARMDVEPTVSQVLFAFTTPEYADYDVKWTVDGQVVSNTGYAYRVKEGNNKIIAEILPKGDFTIDSGVQPIEATVTNTGVTTPESLYYKFLGEASKIKINNQSISYADSVNGLRLRIVSQLIVENGGKLILGDNTEKTTLNVMGTLNLENNESISLINGNVELKSTAKVNVNGIESIGKNGNDIKFLNLKAPEDQLTIEFTKSSIDDKGTIFVYDAVDMTKATYNKLIENYVFSVENGGKLTVEGEMPETPVIPDDSKITVTKMDELKAELSNAESKKTIVIEFVEGEKIAENLEITNRNVEINGDLVVEAEGNISLAGTTTITLNAGSNVEMPKFFVLKNMDTNFVEAMKESSLKVGEEQLIGGQYAKLSILDEQPVIFISNGSRTIASIEGSVQVNGFSFSPIVVQKGASVNLLFTEDNNNGVVTSMGGDVLINGNVLLGNGGPVEPTDGFESNGDIIQVFGKEIILCRNIELNAILPEGFTISTKKQNSNDADFTVNVTEANISASTLGLEGETLSIGTYNVVEGVWTLKSPQVEDSNQPADIVEE